MNIILNVAILILAIPVGFLIAWMGRDELKQGRKYFRILLIASLIIGAYGFFFGKNYVSLTMGFVFIVSIISLIKSKDKKWAVDRIV